MCRVLRPRSFEVRKLVTSIIAELGSAHLEAPKLVPRPVGDLSTALPLWTRSGLDYEMTFDVCDSRSGKGGTPSDPLLGE